MAEVIILWQPSWKKQMTYLDDLSLPLPREEVIKAVDRLSPIRVPLIQAHWWGEGLYEQYGERLAELDRYPEDAAFLWIDLSNYSDWGLPWQINIDGPLDNRCVLKDWALLDEFIAHFPDPELDPRFDELKRHAEQAHGENRYTIFACWRLYFERPWEIRGMNTLLMDYYTYPKEIHRLHEALCELYLGYLRRAVRELHPDGYWSSDDLGHQKQLFMSPKTFKDFLKPYYARMGNFLRQNNVHWWLHSCGNNTQIIPDLIEAGVNVFHPVQKSTMDEAAVAKEYGDKLTFLAGVDVQHILREANCDGVRAEVRKLIDIFDHKNGGMCIAAGNGIVSGTPFENIEAFLDESLHYGIRHRREQ